MNLNPIEKSNAIENIIAIYNAHLNINKIAVKLPIEFTIPADQGSQLPAARGVQSDSGSIANRDCGILLSGSAQLRRISSPFLVMPGARHPG